MHECAHGFVLNRKSAGGTRANTRSIPALSARTNDLLGLRTLRAIAVSAARTARTTSLSARAARTTGTLWAMFIRRDFSVAVLVELLQGHAGLGDFVGVERSVVVEVQREDDRIHRALTARSTGTTAFTARAAAGTTGATFTPRRPGTVGWRIAVLRSEQACRGTECQREEEDFCFHVVMWLLLFPCARRLHRVDAVECPVGAQKELPSRQSRCGIKVGVVAREFVVGHEFEIRLRGEDEHAVAPAHGVNVAV